MDYDQLVQLVLDQQERIAQLEELTDNFGGQKVEKKNVEFASNLKHTGNNVGFFGTDPATQQSDPGDPSTSSVTDQGDTTDNSQINVNISNLENKVNGLRDVLSAYGLI